MLVFNLDLSKTNDFSETLVKKNESLNVYQRKLTMYENRKKFRRENRVFKISEVKLLRLIRACEFQAYSQSGLNCRFLVYNVGKNDERVTYDDYLIPFVSDTDQATCLSLEEL
ncbi:hypothetical protein CWI36_0096p0010 [Hamiltosporidium magnivora]|uniref:Uncharacterized protein n=1 Tax=Hamiltosporidium magnivora TaxID=148818 RepID=A0A4Q9LMS4_9MICR|nr:hypothetical protein CWI36_0096p0010 [Hamiltosporidium magnivora]